ncbi:hypothetical protein CGSSpBS397_07059 [Streptococcus pneumoniae BS397]|nr:hypothetical protein CGSSpBS397_07059 [Streptococcus pneumoniae BS397]
MVGGETNEQAFIQTVQSSRLHHVSEGTVPEIGTASAVRIIAQWTDLRKASAVGAETVKQLSTCSYTED